MPAPLKYLTERKDWISGTFAKWSDNLYYYVDIDEVDAKLRKSLVCFEDGTKHWLPNKDLHLQLSSEDEDFEALICSICEGEKSESSNEIVICDVCEQGYHQKCHLPNITESALSQELDWTCITCHYIMNQVTDNDDDSAVGSSYDSKIKDKDDTTSENNDTETGISINLGHKNGRGAPNGSKKKTGAVDRIVKARKTKSIEEVVGSLKKQSCTEPKRKPSITDDKEVSNGKETRSKQLAKKIKTEESKEKKTGESKEKKTGEFKEKKTGESKEKKTGESKEKKTGESKEKKAKEPSSDLDSSCESVENWEKTLPAPVTDNPFNDSGETESL